MACKPPSALLYALWSRPQAAVFARAALRAKPRNAQAERRSFSLGCMGTLRATRTSATSAVAQPAYISSDCQQQPARDFCHQEPSWGPICTLSAATIQDLKVPVLARDNYVYEKEALQEHINAWQALDDGPLLSPTTQVPLGSEDFKLMQQPNVAAYIWLLSLYRLQRHSNLASWMQWLLTCTRPKSE